MTLARQFEATLQDEPRRPHIVRARPSSIALILDAFLTEQPQLGSKWGPETEGRFRDFRCREQQSGKFAYLSTTAKRLMASVVAQKVTAGIDIAPKLLEFHGVSVEECLSWRNVSTAPSKKLLPLIRQHVKAAYGTRLIGAGSEWQWTVAVGLSQCTTVVTFGGPFCQLSYERYVTFSDSSQSRAALAWEECLGEARPEWDLMTGETMHSDLLLFFTFNQELETRLSWFHDGINRPVAHPQL